MSCVIASADAGRLLEFAEWQVTDISVTPLFSPGHVARASSAHFTMPCIPKKWWRPMEEVDELSRGEMLALQEIRSKGRASDRTIARQLLSDGMIVGSQDGCGLLQLTGKGRRLLVRGSPSLWDMAS